MRTVIALLTTAACALASDADVPAAIEKLADSPSRVVLYSLDPRRVGLDESPQSESVFYGYHIRGRADITDANEQRALIRALARGARDAQPMFNACFNPRHGLRIEKGSYAVDFVICFECLQVSAYGFRPSPDFLTTAGPQPIFDESLRRHNLPLAEKSVVATALARVAEAGDFRRNIPKAPWEPIFFHSINRLTAQAGWTPLRDSPVPPESLEVRVWIGFGLSPLQGFSIRRDGATWTGRFAVERFGTDSAEVREVQPKFGWGKLWKKITNLGVLTLPDSSTLPDEEMVTDGVSYVVEINQNNQYRTYQYGNPEDQRWPQAKQIIEIAQILSDELTPK